MEEPLEETSVRKTIITYGFYVALIGLLLVLVAQTHDNQERLIKIEKANEKRDDLVAQVLERVRGLRSGAVAGASDQVEVDYEKEGGDLRVSFSNDPATIDPLTGTDTTSEEFRTWVVEYLAFRKVDKPEEFELGLAESYEQSEDGKVVTVKLRKDRVWHKVTTPDHTFQPEPFDADDVMFTWTLVFENPQVKADHLRPYLELLERVEKLDAHTVRWHWKEPYFKSVETVLFLFHIAAEHFYTRDMGGNPLPGADDIRSAEFAKQFNEHWSNKEYLCGTGPMLLEKYDRKEGVLVKVKNREYAGRRAHVDRMRYDRVPDENTSYNKLLAGEIDARTLRAREYETQFRNEKRVKSEELRVQKFDYPVYRFIGWNLRKPIFKDKMVRRALTHAVNREFIRDKIFFGHADIQTGPFFAKGPHNSPKVKPWPFDLEEARAILAAEGWADANGDGVLEKRLGGEVTDFRFTLTIYADSVDFKALAETIQSDMRKIGIRVDISPVKWDLFLEKVDNWDFDAFIMGWGLDYLSDPAQLWHSDYANKKGSSNAIGWEDPRTDALIEKIRRTTSDEERNPLYHEFHEILHDEQPYTWLIFDHYFGAYDTRFDGVTFYSTGLRPCRDHREWWLPRDRRKP